MSNIRTIGLAMLASFAAAMAVSAPAAAAVRIEGQARLAIMSSNDM